MFIKEAGVEILNDSIDIINTLRFDLSSNNIQLLQKEPRESGKNIQIQCPYHSFGQENKPSAGIRKSDGIFHCFSCGETHSLVEVISHCFGREDKGYYGTKYIIDKFQTISASRPTQQYEKEKTKEVTQFVSEEELDSYRYNHPYWAKRGITNQHIIEYFDLGYDLKTHMITMPVRDIQGRCEFVAKRSVKTKFFQYPSGVSKPLYGLYELYQSGLMGDYYATTDIKELFICESMIDCILLWQEGYYAVALNGLGNNRQFKQLNELPINHYILATDNDKPGQDARNRIKQNVQRVFSEIVFPKGIKDIGECTKEQIANILEWEK